MANNESYSVLIEWMSSNNFDVGSPPPYALRKMLENLSILKALSGLTCEEIAHKMEGLPDDKPVQDSARLKVAHIMGGQRKKISLIEQVAIACGFNPLLVLVLDLRKRICELAIDFTQDIHVENSVFYVRQCKGCQHLIAEVDAVFCPQCGRRIA